MTIVSGKKECARCRQSLPLTEFWGHRTSSDGYMHKCKYCAMDNRKRIKESRQFVRKAYVAPKHVQILNESSRKIHEKVMAQN